MSGSVSGAPGGEALDGGPLIGIEQIRTPAKGGGLLSGPGPLALAAWLGVRVLKKPLRLGKVIIAARHRHVREVLSRDLDFGIAPVNAGRIGAVNGPFVLGMDRGAELVLERRALYAALMAVDMPALAAKASLDADELLSAAGGSVDVVEGYARRVAGRTAGRLFGIGGVDEALFLEVARAIFAHTFLNLGGDKAIEARALKAAELMRAWLAAEIARRRKSGQLGDDMMGALMTQGLLDDDGVRRTLGGMLVGSIDTTASAVAKIVHVLGRDRVLAERARRDAGDLARMRGWCWEALRRWPHNPLVLRETLRESSLDGVAIPAGARVFAWTQAAMQDAEAFPFPAQMRPDRPSRAYMHLGGGLHVCAGRPVNDTQIPMLVGKLLDRGLGKVGRITWAGPFPDHLTVQLGVGR
ncbi:cytochrome P450 [uncultured Phenylobacterium sp.]|uniref:cytochrome P450 n=1 Tax=uncultured Phenylobacterium sp. TaxID=349273 RepID=UPI0025F7B360|nr:cytochrome P450 [uncultured Phenylobacterium sp.]